MAAFKILILVLSCLTFLMFDECSCGALQEVVSKLTSALSGSFSAYEPESSSGYVDYGDDSSYEGDYGSGYGDDSYDGSYVPSSGDYMSGDQGSYDESTGGYPTPDYGSVDAGYPDYEYVAQ